MATLSMTTEGSTQNRVVNENHNPEIIKKSTSSSTKDVSPSYTQSKSIVSLTTQAKESEACSQAEEGEKIEAAAAAMPEPEPESALAPPMAACNPDLSDNDEEINEDLEVLRGDAIGNTMYSERFVLGAIMKLSELQTFISEDEQYEKELCDVWDMTTHEDVVLLLVKHNVLDLFTDCIDVTDDKRLLEILVGIIGNMVSVPKAVAAITENSEIIITLLKLAGCSDTLTLSQLMRLYCVLFRNLKEDMLSVWFMYICNEPKFIYNMVYLLSYATSEELLANAIVALNTILAVFINVEPIACGGNDEKTLSFADVFIQKSLLEASIEAYTTLVPDVASLECPLRSDIKRSMESFLHIQGIMSQYNEISFDIYDGSMEKVLQCFAGIIQYFCNPEVLLPLTGMESQFVEEINDFLLALDDPVHPPLLANVMTIWYWLVEDIEQRNSIEDEFLSEEETAQRKVLRSDLCLNLFDMSVRQVSKASPEKLSSVILQASLPDQALPKFLNTLQVDVGNKACYEKLKTMYETVTPKPYPD